MAKNKIIKLSTIIGTLFLIVVCFNDPFFIDLSKEKNNMTIKDKLNTKRTVLSSLFNAKASSKLSVYINVSSTNSEQCKLCVNGPLYIDARLLWKQAIGSNCS